MQNDAALARPDTQSSRLGRRARLIVLCAIPAFAPILAHADTPTRPMTTAPAQAALIDPNNDVPPASALDLMNVHTPVLGGLETRGLLWQMVRTCVALAAVLALIFVLAKVLLPRLGMRALAAQPGVLEIVGRLALDGQNGLVWVRVRGRQELLLSVGAGGTRLICEMSPAEGMAFGTVQARTDGETTRG